MQAIRSLVTSRRFAIGALIALGVAGISVGALTYGPSDAEKAYAAACEAIRSQLDDPRSATFPNLGEDGVVVERSPMGTDYAVRSFVVVPDGTKTWKATVNPEATKASFDAGSNL